MGLREDALQRLQQRGKLLISLLQRNKHSHQRDIVLWGGLRILSRSVLIAACLVAVSALLPVLARPLGVVLAVLVWGGLVALVWVYWLRPLRAVPNLAVFSKLVEQRRDFRDMLRAALEFSERGSPSGGSVELSAATVDRAYEEAHGLQLTRLFTFPHRGREAMLLGLGLVFVVACWFASPQVGARALRGIAFAYPSPASIVYGQLEVPGGDRSILAGDDVLVRVIDHGPRAPEMTLRFNDTGDLWKTRQLEPVNEATPYEYEFELENVRDNTAFRFESAGRSTPDFRISVVQRPIVNTFHLRLVPPAYTAREPVTLEDGRGDAIALVGTRVQLSGTSSQPLAHALLVPGEEQEGAVTLPEPLPMEITGNDFQVEFTLRGDVQYHFEIQDRLGHTNADPVSYQLGVIADRPPYVELREPQGDATIPKSLQVPLTIYASDDFGIAKMTLVYKHERDGEDLGQGEKKRVLPLRGPSALDPDGKPVGPGPVPEVVKRFEWDLNDQNLFPGDFITYYIEVEDNDEYSGHKPARTPTYRLRLPTLGEIYAKIQEEDDHRASDLDEVIEKGREVREKFEQLARELKKKPEMDWKKRQEVDSALEKQRELSKAVEDMAKKMQEDLSRMEEQQLVSREIAEKIEQISKLMEEVNNETLREYMERLQEAMRQISPEEIQRAMEQMQLSQEEFLKRLERTKSLLEQLQREQELDALVERVAELLERQEELTSRTEAITPREESEEAKEKAEADSKDDQADKKNSESDQPNQNSDAENTSEKESGEQSEENADEQALTPEEQEQAEQLSRDQADLGEDTEEVEQDLDQLSKELQESGQQQLNEPNDQAQQDKASEQMQRASKQLQQQQPQGAQQSQEKAERRLRALYEQLMQAQAAMSQAMQAQMAEALNRAARESLDVSFRQETLAREMAPIGDYERTGELARGQQALRKATEQIVEELDELSKNNIQAPTQITALLGQVLGKMDQGVEAYEKGNGLAGRVRGEEAYADLNRVTIELNRSARASQSSCSNGTPMPSPGSGMGGAMQRQKQLNDATRQFAERLPNPQNLSPEERARLAELMGQQRSIAGELGDIKRKAAEERDLLGRLDKMEQEMQEVIEDMESEQISEETLRLQEKIVSRMLQAQRSLHKRDYNKERESQVAGDVYSEGGQALKEEDYRKKLRRDIQRALESGSPEEYQDLVRQYFRAIAESEETETP